MTSILALMWRIWPDRMSRRLERARAEADKPVRVRLIKARDRVRRTR